MKQRPSLDEIFAQAAPTGKKRPSLDEIFAEPVGMFDSITKPITEFPEQMRERGAQFANIIQNPNNYNMGSRALQGAANVVGTATDLLGVPVKAGMNVAYDMLPGFAQEGLKKAAPYVKGFSDREALYTRDNPEAGANFKAVRELGALVPFGSAPVRDMAATAVKKGAEIGGSALKNVATDTAMYPVEGISTVAKGMAAKSPAEIGAIKTLNNDVANKYYTAVREAGAELKPEKITTFFDDLNTELTSRGRLNPELHKKTIAIIGDLKKDAEEGILDVERLDQNRRLLSRVKPGLEGKEDYGAAQAAVRVINKFEDSLGVDDFAKGTPEVIDNLKAGRAASHKAMKIEKIGDILKAADGDPNRIKAGLTRFMNKTKNLVGFTEAEKKALYEAASATTAEKILKMGGKFGFDLGTSLTPGNTVAPVVGGLAGGAASSPALGAAIVGGGTIMRQLQKYMARGKAEELIRQLQKGKIPKELGKLPPKEAKNIMEQITKEPTLTEEMR